MSIGGLRSGGRLWTAFIAFGMFAPFVPSTDAWAAEPSASGTGSIALGRAGAVTATLGEPTLVGVNPAGLTELRGHRLAIEFQLRLGNIAFTRTGVDDKITTDTTPGVYRSAAMTSDETPFPGGSLAYGYGDLSGEWGVAVAISDLGGLGWFHGPSDGVQRADLIEADRSVWQLDIGAAWRPHPIVSIGATLTWVTAPWNSRRFTIDLEPGATPSTEDGGAYEAELTYESQALDGISGVIGLHLRPWRFLQFGLSSRVAPIRLTGSGNASLRFTDPTSAGDAANGQLGLSASGITTTQWLPPWIRFGARYIWYDADADDALAPVFDIELDIVWEMWRFTEPERLAFDGDFNDRGTVIPLRAIPLHGLRPDVVSARLGADWTLIPCVLTIRLGLFYESPVAVDKEARIDTLSLHKLGVSFGASFLFGPVEFRASYQYSAHLEGTTANGTRGYARPASTDPLASPITNNGIYDGSLHAVSVGGLISF